MKKILIIGLFCILFCGCQPEDFGLTYDNGSSISLTREIYDSIAEGMTKEQIEELVGQQCNIYYESGDGEEIWCNYWDKDNENIKIVLAFENNSLRSKSQSGIN